MPVKHPAVQPVTLCCRVPPQLCEHPLQLGAFAPPCLHPPSLGLGSREAGSATSSRARCGELRRELFCSSLHNLTCSSLCSTPRSDVRACEFAAFARARCRLQEVGACASLYVLSQCLFSFRLSEALISSSRSSFFLVYYHNAASAAQTPVVQPAVQPADS